jgi:carboxybiotin decarboxylase
MVILGSFGNVLAGLWPTTALAGLGVGNVVMILLGCTILYLAISKGYEPLFLIPIGFGILVGNFPTLPRLSLGVYDEGSVLEHLYLGVTSGIYPSLIFLGLGAMTDFSSLLANPKLALLGAAAQAGVFLAMLGALTFGFSSDEAASIGMIGAANGPAAILLASKLAPHLIGTIAVVVYAYVALVPVIQPPIMVLLTTPEDRRIRMKRPRSVSGRERIIFPIVAFLICALIAPRGAVLLGMLFFGNLLRESKVTERLANTARTALLDIATILMGFCVGASADAQHFLRPRTILILTLGAIALALATAGGVLFGKLMNLFLKEKINPLLGAAGVAVVPDSARVVQQVGLAEDPNNYLLIHANAANVASLVASAVAAGILWSHLAD